MVETVSGFAALDPPPFGLRKGRLVPAGAGPCTLVETLERRIAAHPRYVMRNLMRYLGAFLALVCLGLSTWVGAIYGAGRGGVQYDARFAPSDAFDTTMILRLLRKGEVGEAIARLESKVDLELHMATFYDPSFDRWMGNPGAKAANLENRVKILKMVEKYQAEFPYYSSVDRIWQGSQALEQDSTP